MERFTIGKVLVIFCLIFTLTSTVSAQPDTLTHRYATMADAAYWPQVNEGDYLIFGPNWSNHAVYYRDDHPSFPTIATDLGKKILIWRGEYTRIYIEGGNCQNSEAQPTVITNFGGQVKVGYNPVNRYRSLHLVRFEHLHVTGKYDPAAQTGDANFLGHNDGQDFGSGAYYERYGIWANPRWMSERDGQPFDSPVRASYFQTLKIDYVASFGGGFASFNLKSDHPNPARRVKLDVQDCFAGFCKGEGFYIGRTSGPAESDINQLILRNNIVVCAGAESFQTGILGEGSVIENNIGLFSGTFFRRPFQARFQDNGHQLTWVEGDIMVRNNMIVGVPAQPLMVFWLDGGQSRVNPAANKPLSIQNNYYGFARTNLAYMNNTQDSVTPIFFQHNVIGPISSPATRDGYTSSHNLDWNVYARLRPCPNPLTVSDNIYPTDRPLYDSCFHNQQLAAFQNSAEVAPTPAFVNAGFPADFDYRRVTFWSAQYEMVEQAGQYIPYQVGDVVFTYDSAGYNRFYECVQAHAGDWHPATSAAYWQPMDWNGRHLPPLDLRLMPNSYYANRGMGLTYQYQPPMPDTTANRYATSADAAYWPTVNEGDFLIFQPNWSNDAVYYRDDNPAFPTIATDLGKKIMLWRGEYTRVYLEGGNCQNSEAQPTVITNFGGQVKVGHNELTHLRGLNLRRFDHLHLSGKHDPAAQTGDPNYRGHDAGNAMGSGDYYERYGIWVYPRFGAERNSETYTNSVEVSHFQTLKVDYVAAYGGGMAAFRLQTPNPAQPGRVKIDVQDCFAGFCRGQGFMIGRNGGFSNADINQLILRNNLVVAAGAEGLHTNMLGDGTVIEHNVVLFSGSYFRRPFSKNRDHGHSITWVEGGITVRDNLLAGAAGNSLMIFWANVGNGRANPAANKPFSLENNYYGHTRTNLAFLNNSQDPLTPIFFQDNVFGPIATPAARDGYTNPGYQDWNVYARLRTCVNPLTVANNLYPQGRPLFDSCYHNQNLVNVGNVAGAAAIPEYVDLGFPDGFDHRRVTIWSAQYETVDLAGQYIPYQPGDVVYYFDADGHIHFFECLAAHAGNLNPFTSPAQWQPLTWSGRSMPPLDVRMMPGSYYFQQNIGLDYGSAAAAGQPAWSSLSLDPQATQVEQGPANPGEVMTVQHDSWAERLTISLPRSAGGQLRIMTVLGEDMALKTVTEQQVDFPTGSWPAGIYLVKWTSGSAAQLRKVLVN